MRAKQVGALLMAVVFAACGSSGGGSGSPMGYSQTVTAYNNEGLDSATKASNLSDAYNDLLVLNISGSDPDTVDSKMAAYLTAFGAYNTNIQNLHSYANTTFGLSSSEAIPPPLSTKGAPGPVVPGSTSALSGQTLSDLHDKLTTKKAECDALLANYKSITDIIARAEALQAFNKCSVELQALGAKEGFKIVVVKAAGGAAGGATGKIVGTAIVYYVAGAAALATPAGLLVIAASVIGGGIIGSKAAGAIFDYCTSDSGVSSAGGAKGISSGEYCAVSSASGSTGTPMSMVTSPGTGTLQVFVDGYAPVSLSGISIAAGQTLTVNVTLKPLTEITDDSESDVTSANAASTSSSAASTASSCSGVASIIATNTPADPGPGQSVSVTATVVPAIQGCAVSYSVAGTDGYAAAASPTTNASGQISFTIPGGAADIHDVVNMTESASGVNTTLAYTF